MRIMLGALPAVLLIASAQAADVPPAQEAEVTLRDFRFHTGETLPELRMHYRTVGSSSGEPVLILHGTSQSGAAMMAQVRRGAVRAGSTAGRLEILHHLTGLDRCRWVQQTVRWAARQISRI